MTLRFVNPSRSFDETRKAVGFVGHDGIFEIRFFVEAGALGERGAEAHEISEANCLTAFDKSVKSIHAAAQAAYSHKRLKSYTLSAADFS